MPNDTPAIAELMRNAGLDEARVLAFAAYWRAAPLLAHGFTRVI